MNLKFWKKNQPVDEKTEASDDKTEAIDMDAVHRETAEGTVRPSLAARLRNIFASLALRRHKHHAASTQESSPETESSPAQAISHSNLKKRLIVGGMIGVMVLLLAGIGFTAWIFFSQTPEKTHPPQETAVQPVEPPPPPAAAPAPPIDHALQAELEALKTQNQEMAAQIEALKKEKEQAPPPDTTPEPPPAPVSTKKSTPAPFGEQEVTVFSGKDPKASAEVLRQAIEEMNAADERRKPRSQKESQ